MKIRTSDNYQRGISGNFDFPYSNNAVKRYHYGCESYFQEAYSEMRDESFDFARLSEKLSYVLLKPDFFVSRKCKRLANVLRALDCKVIGVFEHQFCRFSIRELWRYEFNTADIDRYNLIDKLLKSGPSLLLLIEKNSSGSFDFCKEITELKKLRSSPQLENQTIRQYLQCGKGTLNYIHSPDEFIDLVRELGVLFDEEQRKLIYEAIRQSKEIDYLTILYKTAEHYPQIDFSAAQSSKDNSNTVWDEIIELNQHVKFKNPHVTRVFDFEEAYNGST